MHGHWHGLGLPTQFAHELVHWRPVVLATAVAMPVAATIAVALARHRCRRGWPRGWAVRSAWVDVLMIAGTLPWVVLTLSPDRQPRGVNLVPLRDLHMQIQHGYGYAAVQIGGNLLVFAALGFGMPIRWRVGPAAALLAGACGSAAIETLQWVLDLGRYSSIDDVLVNAIGALLGAVASWPWWRGRLPESAISPISDPDRGTSARSTSNCGG